MSICENFLRVADLVLSWNFEIRRFPVRITFANEAAPAATLRPPESWKPIFQSDEFLRLFFELHKRVRHNEILCMHSLNCLIQLSSLIGPVLTDSEPVISQKLSTTSTSNIFGSGPLEGEILGLCLIVYKLLTYHRILSFPRAEMSFVTFVNIIVQCTEHLTSIAIILFEINKFDFYYTNSAKIVIISRIIGVVLAWCSIEHKLLMDRGAEAISPELARSSLWCMRRLICSLGFHVMNPEDSEQLASIIKKNLQAMVDFALQKSFGILNNLSGELCLDAVEVFVGLVCAGCNEAAKSPFLFPCLSTIQIERLPARHSFIKVLVQIGSMANDENVLQPLRERFMLLSKERTSLETDLVDLLDCFGGLAEAAQNHNTHFLFEYLSPILTSSISLLLSYKESQLLTNAVLDLFNNVTKRMGVYSENHSDMVFLCETLLELIRVYRDGQFTRYKVIDVDVEEKASDLIILLDILANVLSKDDLSIIPLSSSEFATMGSRVALIALEMLLPIMEDDLLKLPSLCRKFYRFILYFTEMAPQTLESLPEALFVSIIECLRHGLRSDFGQEVADGIYISFHICSWQVDLQNASATALFALICCNQVYITEYVKQLLSRDENRPYQATLQSAFQALLPANLEFHLGRREKREFRDRLEQFLNQAQGLLVVE
uniref:Exportin-4 n=1 Tax=Brugia malayi TaxID=6279 RepID=A0A0J9YAY1_BRUMA|nr:Bm7015 [Brugia malayi]